METTHPPTAQIRPITHGLGAAESLAPARVDLPPDQLARVKRSETLLRIDQVEARVGFRKSKIYALAKEEPLLRPVLISARCVAWPESRIDAYIAKVIARSDAGADLLAGPGTRA
jgi:prophage regulatory protein